MDVLCPRVHTQGGGAVLYNRVCWASPLSHPGIFRTLVWGGPMQVSTSFSLPFEEAAVGWMEAHCWVHAACGLADLPSAPRVVVMGSADWEGSQLRSAH